MFKAVPGGTQGLTPCCLTPRPQTRSCLATRLLSCPCGCCRSCTPATWWRPACRSSTANGECPQPPWLPGTLGAPLWGLGAPSSPDLLLAPWTAPRRTKTGRLQAGKHVRRPLLCSHATPPLSPSASTLDDLNAEPALARLREKCPYWFDVGMALATQCAGEELFTGLAKSVADAFQSRYRECLSKAHTAACNPEMLKFVSVLTREERHGAPMSPMHCVRDPHNCPCAAHLTRGGVASVFEAGRGSMVAFQAWRYSTEARLPSALPAHRLQSLTPPHPGYTGAHRSRAHSARRAAPQAIADQRARGGRGGLNGGGDKDRPIL